MAINVIDGFRVNSPNPVDYRMVVNTIAARNAIQYKYDGMRVFVIADRKTYTYILLNGQWDVDISGTPDRIPVFNSTGAALGDSIISQSASNVITLNDTDSFIRSTGRLTLSAGTDTSAGSNVVIIGGSSSNTGGNIRIYGGTGGTLNGDVFLSFNTSPIGRVGIRTNTFDSGVSLQVSGNATFNNTLRVVSNATFNSATSSIVSAAHIVSTNNYSTKASPDYTWSGNTNTGIFHPEANKIGISSNGLNKVLINPTNVEVLSGGGEVVSVSVSNVVTRLNSAVTVLSSTNTTLRSGTIGKKLSDGTGDWIPIVSATTGKEYYITPADQPYLVIEADSSTNFGHPPQAVHPATTYDRQITIANNGGSGTAFVEVWIENGIDTRSFIPELRKHLSNISNLGSYECFPFLVPALCRFLIIYGHFNNFKAVFQLRERKFGRLSSIADTATFTQTEYNGGATTALGAPVAGGASGPQGT